MAIIGSHNEQGAYPIMAFQVSQTWTCPVAMEAIVYVIGAGGSGATVGSYYHAARNATGGGAGGSCLGFSVAGAAGGAGIVVLRYKTDEGTITFYDKKTEKPVDIEETSNDYNFLGNNRKPYFIINYLR